MRCALCKKEAVAICKFCGRAVCQKHRHIKPYIMSSYDEDNDSPKFLVVEDATWCGRCNPISSPISVPESE